jgi:hypothetical protein
LLVKCVLRLSVLLIIRWFRVPPLGAPLGVPGPGRDQVPAIVARIEGRLGRAPQPLPSYGYPLGVPLVPWQVIADLAAHPAPASAYGEEDHDESA